MGGQQQTRMQLRTTPKAYREVNRKFLKYFILQVKYSKIINYGDGLGKIGINRSPLSIFQRRNAELFFENYGKVI